MGPLPATLLKALAEQVELHLLLTLVYLMSTGNRLLTYSRNELLLHRTSLPCNVKPDVVLPPELRPRKRGRREGIRSRIRKRPFKPPLPSIILANVHSLRNKMDLLRPGADWKGPSGTFVSLLCPKHG